jgi:hypothetical protein
VTSFRIKKVKTRRSYSAGPSLAYVSHAAPGIEVQRMRYVLYLWPAKHTGYETGSASLSGVCCSAAVLHER